MGESGLCNLCDTSVYFESVGSQQRNAKKYVNEKLSYPDEGSNFDRELGKIKYLFRIPGVNGLITSVGL